MFTLALHPRLFEFYHLNVQNNGQVSQWWGVCGVRVVVWRAGPWTLGFVYVCDVCDCVCACVDDCTGVSVFGSLL